MLQWSVTCLSTSIQFKNEQEEKNEIESSAEKVVIGAPSSGSFIRFMIGLIRVSWAKYGASIRKKCDFPSESMPKRDGENAEERGAEENRLLEKSVN